MPVIFALLLYKARHRTGCAWQWPLVLSALPTPVGVLEIWRLDQSGGMSALTVFTGVFLNRNHFGFRMLLGILAGMGLLTAATKRASAYTPSVWRGCHPYYVMLFAMQRHRYQLSRLFMATVIGTTSRVGLAGRGACVAAYRQKIFALAYLAALLVS